MARTKALTYVVALICLQGCAGMLSWEADSYVVQSGDTLYKIAWKYGLDYRDIAQWNELDSVDFIRAGQTLRLSPPDGWSKSGRSKTTTASGSSTPRRSSTATPRTSSPPPSAWRWPTSGELVSRFGQGTLGGNGIDIAGRAGQPVMAAAGGQVVYSGSGLIGYGQLIIIKHNDTYLSAYGHNRELRVSEGDRVSAGQTIAHMGNGPGKQPALHFEIRRNGKPVDPLGYLPGR
ncbi:MAG: peptidoglycan DD-metalloendopeptidase family protein [Gammaproteobacteria bacterium]|nr:MAG: peptidoglycan DD-metalloendopeptidase family protein [Gammaproteobacteria bacterium]